MLKNYFKIALRNFKKRRGYAFINVAGLAVGMACCLLIALFVRHERSYDRYHEHADRIFRLVEERARVGAPFAPALLNEFPEVEQAVRLHHMFWTTPLLQVGERGFYEDRIFFADSSLFDVFSFRLLRGDPKTALAAPFSMILTEAMAAKYFGDADPMGQVISYDNTHTYTVTGIVENTPLPSHFRFDFLASFSTLYVLEEFWGMPLTWTNPTATTYLLLSDPDAAEALEARLPDFIVKHRGEAFGNGRTFHLQPLTDIHLTSHLRFEIEPNSDAAYLYIFSAIEPLLMHLCPFAMNVSVRVRTDDLPATVAALERTWQQFSPTFPFDYYFLDEAFESRYRAEERAGQLFGYFVLLAVFIACLGLFGLAAFSAAQRTKEIGIRKVLGASVGGIVVLLSKDFVKLVGWAFVVATPLAYLAMSRWLDNFPYHVELSWRIFLVVGLAAFVVAVLTVSYQSIRAALTDPVKALRYE